MFVLGVDIGGTFTDFSLVDLGQGTEYSLKLPTNHDSLSDPVLAGMATLLDEAGALSEGVAYMTHGSTIAINTIIERSGAKLGLLCTAGFGDVLELRRVRLPIPMRFDATRPDPLIPRERVREIRERMGPDGRVVIAPSVEDVTDQVASLVRDGAEGIVVALLHSYVNPSSEREVREFVERNWPKLPIQCSHEILPQMREYERTVCTTINAYVVEPVTAYIRQLRSRAQESGLHGKLYITKSSGGCTTALDAMRRPVETLLSGPASGVVGAADVASRAGFSNVLTFDMGGTSTDIGIVRDGQIVTSREAQVGDFPLLLPAVEVTSLGAGGSSIAYSSAAGVLRVGPRSAGATPGPACYGLGGKEVTVTDALLATGVLSAETFAGGRMQLRRADAETALDRLGSEVGLPGHQCADAIVQIASSVMVRGLKGVIARHGLDPADYILLAFGGAGPAFAPFLAREVGISTVLVPRRPGTLCALGSLAADLRGDFVRTVHRKLADLPGAELCDAIAALVAEATDWLGQVSDSSTSPEVAVVAAVRYVGQAWELDVPLSHAELTAESASAHLVLAFHNAHRALYGHSDFTNDVELVELHASVVGRRMRIPDRPIIQTFGSEARAGARDVVLEGTPLTARIVERDSLSPGDVVVGPAIVEQGDATTVVPVDFTAVTDARMNLLVQVGCST